MFIDLKALQRKETWILKKCDADVMRVMQKSVICSLDSIISFDGNIKGD